MGEYMCRISDGEDIKIGTCEDLYYLRYDQLDKVESNGDANPRAHLDVYRFRFPFPDEDDIEPGQFEDYNRGINLFEQRAPADLPHYRVQFKATNDRGYLVSLPCPESGDQFDIVDASNHSDAGTALTIHRNGYRGGARLTQQAVRNNRLVSILECGGCGVAWHLPTITDALPLITELEDMNLHAVARRVIRGYDTWIGKPRPTPPRLRMAYRFNTTR